MLTGFITALVPDGFLARAADQEFLSILLAAALGIPLYMCASSSTPVAAALLAKGLSPGAALVFLLTGPATNAATLSVLARVFGRRFVAIAHAFVAGGEGSDSELGLAVGGTGEVDATLFRDCDYAALGHLHRPQAAGYPHVRYAGSLLKYSASEAGHTKALTLVELPERGPAHTEPLPLTPRRDLRRLRGHFDDLLREPQGNPDDYLFLDLLDQGPVLDAMARLRQVYPNILGIQPAPLAAPGPEPMHAADRDLDPATLFETFFRDTAGRGMDDGERALFREVAGRLLAGEAE